MHFLVLHHLITHSIILSNAQIFPSDLRPRQGSLFLRRGMMMRPGRWNLNFIIFCPSLAAPWLHRPGHLARLAPVPDLLSLQQFAPSPPLSSHPHPPLQTSTWRLSWPHAVLTAVLQTLSTRVHTWTKQDWAQQGRDDGALEHWGPAGPVLLELHCFTSPWLRLGWGEWSQAALPPPAAGALNCGQATLQRFRENAIWSVFKVFISAKLWADWRLAASL